MMPGASLDVVRRFIDVFNEFNEWMASFYHKERREHIEKSHVFS
jgi:hypothetical protein